MAIELDLAIGQKVPLHTDGDYLLLRAATGAIELSKNGGQGYGMMVGETIETKTIDKLILNNVSGALNTVVFESVDFEVKSSGVSGVNVLNKPVIQKIEESINVNAQATVDNGTVHVIPAGSVSETPDTTINATTGKQLLAANAARKAVIFQVISATKTNVRFGGVNIAAGRGLMAAGSAAAPAVVVLECKGAIHAYNESASQAKISITEVLQ